MIRRAVVAAMDRWHFGPHGGRCPRTDGPECSRYGVDAVTRYGVLIGTIAAARYVAACRVEDTPGGDGPWCAPTDRPGQSYRRWELVRVMFLFARIGLFGQAPPGRQCGRNDPHGGGSGGSR